MAYRSIALTRIHTPEDYWNRMALAEQKLVTYWCDNNHTRQVAATASLHKAQQLSDRYHEHWTINRKEYFG